MTSADYCSFKYPVTKKKQVVVVGGGPSGCLAALAAARNGADTLLIERESYLGGMMTGGEVGGSSGVSGYYSQTEGSPTIVKGISIELYERLEAMGGATPFEEKFTRFKVIDPAIMVHALDEMVEESKVEVLFNTIAFDALVEKNAVKGVVIANKSGGQVVLADVVVDNSADCDIAAAAGAPFVIGRAEDNRTQGGGLIMQIGGIDIDRFMEYLKTQPDMTEKERQELEEDRSRLLGAGRPPGGSISEEGKPTIRERDRRLVSWDEIEKARKEGRRLPLRMATRSNVASAPRKEGKYVPLPPALDREWINYIRSGKVPPVLGATELCYPEPYFGGIDGWLGVFKHGAWRYDLLWAGSHEMWFDQTSQDAISRALLYMRRLNKIHLEFLRDRIPGFEKAYIVLEAPTVGTRDSRRIIGEYVLTENDMKEGRKFPDVVAVGGYSAGLHAVTGLWGDGRSLDAPPKLFDIPYRCLVPKKIDNLLVGSRGKSTTHLAQGGTRSMVKVMATGEAAGVAAALSSTLGVAPRNLDVKLLQKALMAQGVLLYLEDEIPGAIPAV